jgi:ABC-type antimicrobial peptide transport system permease subunit
MNSRDLLELCWGNLLRRRTRTILSIIGVVVGTAAIVVMLSIGFGLSASFQEQIESFGNLHMITVNSYGGGQMLGGGGGGNGQNYSLDDSTISKMEKIDGVTAITPQDEQYLNIMAGHYKVETSVVGIRPEVMELFGMETGDGRLLNGSDAGKYNMVFGKNVAQWFYNPREQMYGGWGSGDGEPVVNVVGEKMTLTGDWTIGTRDEGTSEIKYESFEGTGVGLLASENDESAYRVYMDIEALQKIKASIQKSENNGQASGGNGKKTYNTAVIYAEDINKIKGICDYIKDTYGFSTYSLNDMLEEMNQTARIIEGVLGGIGAISLLVAAIGIANTMVMSVYERTKEIGVMKVIGASLGDIGNMFMIEAAMIGFIGGVFGLIVSFGLSWLLNTVGAGLIQNFIGGGGSTVSVIPWWVAIAALLFATVMGLISGYAPARKAMNLSALEGLRND